MKKLITALFSTVCIFLLAACGPDKETDYPAAIMVDGVIYYLSVTEASEEIRDSEILGYTEFYTEAFPKKDGECNFNRKIGMPYARVEAGIAVYMNDTWYLCFPEGQASSQDFSLPEKMPEDFSFALTWGCYGISSYDSTSGILVKTTHATHPEDYVTSYELPEEVKNQIYDEIRVLDPVSYPDVYDPQEGGLMSSPSMTLILTVCANGKEKTIKAVSIACTYKSEDEKGQLFLSTCKAIETILTETEEWKALPEYEFFYE